MRWGGREGALGIMGEGEAPNRAKLGARGWWSGGGRPGGRRFSSSSGREEESHLNFLGHGYPKGSGSAEWHPASSYRSSDFPLRPGHLRPESDGKPPRSLTISASLSPIQSDLTGSKDGASRSPRSSASYTSCASRCAIRCFSALPTLRLTPRFPPRLANALFPVFTHEGRTTDSHLLCSIAFTRSRSRTSSASLSRRCSSSPLIFCSLEMGLARLEFSATSIHRQRTLLQHSERLASRWFKLGPPLTASLAGTVHRRLSDHLLKAARLGDADEVPELHIHHSGDERTLPHSAACRADL